MVERIERLLQTKVETKNEGQDSDDDEEKPEADPTFTTGRTSGLDSFFCLEQPIWTVISCEIDYGEWSCQLH